MGRKVRERLNGAFVVMGFVIALLVGGFFNSFAFAVITFLAVMVFMISRGDIRPAPPGRGRIRP